MYLEYTKHASSFVCSYIQQSQGTGQELITVKSRLEKKGLTMQRLELVSAQMAARLMDNVQSVFDGLPLRHSFGCLNSEVAL